MRHLFFFAQRGRGYSARPDSGEAGGVSGLELPSLLETTQQMFALHAANGVNPDAIWDMTYGEASDVANMIEKRKRQKRKCRRRLRGKMRN